MSVGNLMPNTAVTAATTTTSAQSAVLSEGAPYLIVATTASWFLLGSNPSLLIHAANGIYLPANTPYTFIAPPGSNKVALLADTTAGFYTLCQCFS